MVNYDRTDEDMNATQTVPTCKSKSRITNQSMMSSELQKRLKLSIERISKTPALKVGGTKVSSINNLISSSDQLSSSRTTRRESIFKKSSLREVTPPNPTTPAKRNNLNMLLQPTPIKYQVTAASPVRTSLMSQQYTTANST